MVVVMMTNFVWVTVVIVEGVLYLGVHCVAGLVVVVVLDRAVVLVVGKKRANKSIFNTITTPTSTTNTTTKNTNE